jgi:putative ABC transport system permease protein
MSKIYDYFKYPITNLLHRRLRSYLTILGIMIGIAALVSLVSLGQGLQKYIDESFSEMGGDLLMIQQRAFVAPGMESSFNLSEDDLSYVERIPGIEDAYGMILDSVKIEHNDQVRYYYAFNWPTGSEKELVDDMFQLDLAEGRELRSGDKFAVTLGAGYAIPNRVFEKPVRVNDRILLNDVSFRVVGFYESVGNPEDDKNIYMTLDGLLELFPEKEDKYFYIIARVEPDKSPSGMAEVVTEKLRRYRDEEEGKETFFVQTFEQLIESFSVVIVVLQGILFLIAFISLFVGAIGIMNTMYTAVLERTREIGVMKAIGAQNHDVFILFTVEAGLLGLVGGIVGIIIGYLISVGLSAITAASGWSMIKPFFPWYLMLGAIIFAFLTGALSGAIPAYQAAKQNPVDALHYE